MRDDRHYTTNTSIFQLAIRGNGRILHLSKSSDGRLKFTNNKGDAICTSRGKLDELVNDGYLLPQRGMTYVLTLKALNMATKRR